METTTLQIPTSAVTSLQEANPKLLIVVLPQQNISVFGVNLTNVSLPVNTPFICVDANTVIKIVLHNPHTLFEQSGPYILSIVHMAGLPSSQNADLIISVGTWNNGLAIANRGRVFDGQAEFNIPHPFIMGGGKRRADVAYIARAKWMAIPQQQRERRSFTVLPDLVIENKSYGPGENNTLEAQKTKMDMWIAAGVQFGILVCGELCRHYLYCHVIAGAAPIVFGAVQRPGLPSVYRLRVNWPAPAAANPEYGPAIVINGVGATAGLVINLATYPLL